MAQRRERFEITKEEFVKRAIKLPLGSKKLAEEEYEEVQAQISLMDIELVDAESMEQLKKVLADIKNLPIVPNPFLHSVLISRENYEKLIALGTEVEKT